MTLVSFVWQDAQLPLECILPHQQIKKSNPLDYKCVPTDFSIGGLHQS